MAKSNRRPSLICSFMFAALLAFSPILSSCSSMRAHWGVEGSSELVSDGHGGYYRVTPPHKHKKPKKHKKHKHHDNGRRGHDFDD